MTFCPSWERQCYTKKYDNLKLVNLVQTNEILLIENSTYLNIRFEIFGWICMYVCIDRIWRWMTYKGWYTIKPKQPTNNHRMPHSCSLDRRTLFSRWNKLGGKDLEKAKILSMCSNIYKALIIFNNPLGPSEENNIIRTNSAGLPWIF